MAVNSGVVESLDAIEVSEFSSLDNVEKNESIVYTAEVEELCMDTGGIAISIYFILQWCFISSNFCQGCWPFIVLSFASSFSFLPFRLS